MDFYPEMILLFARLSAIIQAFQTFYDDRIGDCDADHRVGQCHSAQCYALRRPSAAVPRQRVQYKQSDSDLDHQPAGYRHDQFFRPVHSASQRYQPTDSDSHGNKPGRPDSVDFGNDYAFARAMRIKRI